MEGDHKFAENLVGRDVLIARTSFTLTTVVRLEEVTDWGIVCFSRDPYQPNPTLIAWRELEWMRLAYPDEIQTEDYRHRPKRIIRTETEYTWGTLIRDRIERWRERRQGG